MYDFAIVGGGIVGLSTGMALGQRYPDARILVLEKESRWAFHQTGNNSGRAALRRSFAAMVASQWWRFARNMVLITKFAAR
jgi:glycine/D-amino acid oxidase-like deaminating enzyme